MGKCELFSPYIFQYINECVQECPSGTILNSNNICINQVENSSCTIVQKKINIDISDLIDENDNNINDRVTDYIFNHQGINSEIYLYTNEK